MYIKKKNKTKGKGNQVIKLGYCLKMQWSRELMIQRLLEQGYLN